MTITATATDVTRVARIPLTVRAGYTEPTAREVRRGRLQALCALSDVLTRDALEVHGEPRFTLTKGTGAWWVEVTATARPETWRTSRERHFEPCGLCHRRGYGGTGGVRWTADGWRCANTATCAAAVPRARVCKLCGALGTTRTHFTTPQGVYCRDGAACEAAEAAREALTTP